VGKENGQIVTKLKCAAGLAELAQAKYKSAAKYFLEANFDYCDFSDMISPNSVATYGALCALASFDREELKKHVIANRYKRVVFLDVDIIRFYPNKRLKSFLV
jgi:COP9 signalosome complex subunit 1